jgi:hypothetical protein
MWPRRSFVDRHDEDFAINYGCKNIEWASLDPHQTLQRN